MFFNKLSLKNYGIIANRELELKDGVNVICDSKQENNNHVKSFLVDMLYGVDKAYGLEKMNDEGLLSVHTKNGDTGKAYIKEGENTYFIERNMSPNNRKMSGFNIKTGRDVRPVNGSSLSGVLFDMDKTEYVNTMIIGDAKEKSSADIEKHLNSYLTNMSETGTSDLDREKIVENLKNQRNKFSVSEYEYKISDVEKKIGAYDGVEDELKDVREHIKLVDEAFAMETAKRKREARKLIDTSNKEGEEIDDELTDTFEALAENAAFLDANRKEATFLDTDNLELPKEKKPLQDRVWVIVLTAVFVVSVIALLVYLLPFENAVRQLFIVCTALLCIVTIVEGMYTKQMFSDENVTPTEEDFKQVIYELERKTEAYEDVEIDMSFAKEFLDEKSELQKKETDIIVRINEREKLKSELAEIEDKLKATEKEIHAINLAINTVLDISSEIKGENGDIVDDSFAPYVEAFTEGRYRKVKFENKQLKVWEGKTFAKISDVSANAAKQIYLAVKCGIAAKHYNKLPVIVDGILDNYSDSQKQRILNLLSQMGADQIVVFTSDENLATLI